MRVTFPRLPDYARGYSIVERDDGVTYRLWGGPVTARLPHDLVHLAVEDALDISDGVIVYLPGSGVLSKARIRRDRQNPRVPRRGCGRAYVQGTALALRSAQPDQCGDEDHAGAVRENAAVLGSLLSDFDFTARPQPPLALPEHASTDSH